MLDIFEIFFQYSVLTMAGIIIILSIFIGISTIIYLIKLLMKGKSLFD